MKNALRIILLPTVLLFFGMLGCLPQPNVVPASPTPTPSNYTMTAAQRINYVSGATNRQHFDFYTAEGDNTLRPVILYVHGGAWVFGPEAGTYDSFIKSNYDIPCKNLTQTLINYGFAVAIMKYRQPKYTKIATTPANVPVDASPLHDIMSDIDNAISKLTSESDRLKIDSSRIGLLGDSAGALLVTDYAYGNFSGINNQSKVKTVVTFYGPYDLSKPDITPNHYSYPYNGHTINWFQQPAALALFGNPLSEDEDSSPAAVAVYLMRAFDALTGSYYAKQDAIERRAFSPVSYAESKGPMNIPSTFVIHAANDQLVNPNQVNYMKAALNASDYTDANASDLNKRHLVKSMVGFNHGFVKVGYTSGFAAPFDSEIAPKVVRWYLARLKN